MKIPNVWILHQYRWNPFFKIDPFFSHSKQKKNYQNESYLTQFHAKGFQNVKLIFQYSKLVISENSKCLDFVSVQVKPMLQTRAFFSHAKQNEKWIIFDTMAYRRLLKYQISFPLFKVSEPWKFQMSGFCISTGETHTSKKGILLLFQTE